MNETKDTTTPQMNVELLRQVQARILAEPNRFFMEDWFAIHDCETTCCIAGWGRAIHEQMTEQQMTEFAKNGTMTIRMQSQACAAFGISDRQGDNLFLWTEWPEPFRTQFGDTCFREGWSWDENGEPDGSALWWEDVNSESQVRIAAAVIDDFIATNGWTQERAAPTAECYPC